jgi:aryl-alcohol dehydrogenase-like predicted oxidoreductase
MNHRKFSNLNREVSEIGLGCWQIGGTEWGDVSDTQAVATLKAATESGMTFLDTADIYGHGRSEQLIGQFLKQSQTRDSLFIATKFGRRSDPGWPENFSPTAVRQHTDDSLKRLGVEIIDLTQSHCLPMDLMLKHGTFEALNELKQAGKIRAFGSSVETIAEAHECLKIPGLSSLQIIFNIFRQAPIDELFAEAKKKQVAIIVRLPLASGLLSGKINRSTQFAATDHRVYNRHGEQFNVGETFSGIPFDEGLQLVEEFRAFVRPDETMAQWALRWCLDFPEVTVLIPGAKHAEQALENAQASLLHPLGPEVHQRLKAIYKQKIRDLIRGKV